MSMSVAMFSCMVVMLMVVMCGTYCIVLCLSDGCLSAYTGVCMSKYLYVQVLLFRCLQCVLYIIPWRDCCLNVYVGNDRYIGLKNIYKINNLNRYNNTTKAISVRLRNTIIA